jgi:hypothetical protein
MACPKNHHITATISWLFFFWIRTFYNFEKYHEIAFYEDAGISHLNKLDRINEVNSHSNRLTGKRQTNLITGLNEC